MDCEDCRHLTVVDLHDTALDLRSNIIVLPCQAFAKIGGGGHAVGARSQMSVLDCSRLYNIVLELTGQSYFRFPPLFHRLILSAIKIKHINAISALSKLIAELSLRTL